MTTQIIALQPHGIVVPTGMTPEHLAFCLARQLMMRRLLEWLRAGGDLADILQETEPVAAVMQQLIELERHHATR